MQLSAEILPQPRTVVSADTCYVGGGNRKKKCKRACLKLCEVIAAGRRAKTPLNGHAEVMKNNIKRLL